MYSGMETLGACGFRYIYYQQGIITDGSPWTSLLSLVQRPIDGGSGIRSSECVIRFTREIKCKGQSFVHLQSSEAFESDKVKVSPRVFREAGSCKHG